MSDAQPITLTLILCLITAVSRILLKRGIEGSNALTGMVFSLVIGWLALTTIAVATVPLAAFNLKGVLFFALIGLVAPPVVRYLTYIGVERVGAARSDPVRALTPLFAILFAMLFLGEKAGPAVFWGTLLIIFGVYFLSREGGVPYLSGRKWRKTDLLFPFGAAVLAGLVANMRKWGGGVLPSPVLAATVAATSAIFVFGIFLGVTGRWRNVKLGRASGKLLFLSGLLTSATDVLDLMALNRGRVSVVVPMLATTPLFIIVLSHFFLKGIEKITLYLVAGAITIIGGVELILMAAK